MTKYTSASASPELLQSLRQLIASCGSKANKHDVAIVCIQACIADGVDTKPFIIGTLMRVGFKSGHVALLLDDCAGIFPESHHWRLDAAGRYHLHDVAATEA
jgi:hypothetical protein